jgi:hypothetical protein
LQNWIIARLKELKEFQAAHPVVDPEDWPESVDLIFITEFGRPMNVNSLVYKHFKPILKRAALPEHQTLWFAAHRRDIGPNRLLKKYC